MIPFLLAHPILFVLVGTFAALTAFKVLFNLIDYYNQTRPHWPWRKRRPR